MSNIDRRYSYHDDGVLPSEGEYGVTYLTLYSSGAGNCYDGWIWDPDHRTTESETERTFGYRNPDYTDYCWDDEVIVDLSNAQTRQESSEFEQGRITSFNTNVSSRPIVLQDIDITGLDEEEREALATTVLFSAIPLVKDAYIQAMIEIQAKMNISPTNTNGMVRIEAFYILNNESDRTMRPNPVHTFSVSTANERHTLPWLYWNPALKHEDNNYIGVKLLCTGGTAEIGISDDPEYGDAIITLTSAGLIGDHIDSGHPVSLDIYGIQEVVPGYKLKEDDFTVIATYDTGEVYDVTRVCNFSPAMGTSLAEPEVLLTAYYQGLSVSLTIRMAEFGNLILTGVSAIHGEYTLDIDDYVVMAYYENGMSIDVTNECIFYPQMGTRLTQSTTLTATWVDPLNITRNASLNITSQSVKYQSDTNNDIVYTMYHDGYLTITGEVSDSWTLHNDIKDSSNGVHVGSQTGAIYTDDISYQAAKYYVDGHGIKNTSQRTNVQWTPGSDGDSAQARFFFEVRVPSAWAREVRKIDYRLIGKPLGLNLCSIMVKKSYSYTFNNEIEYIGFENLDASKIISMYGCFMRDLNQGGSAATTDLSFLNNLEFPVLDDISYAFSNNDIGKFTLNAPNVRYAYRTFWSSKTINSNLNNKVFGNNTMSKLIVMVDMFRHSKITNLDFASGWRLWHVVDARHAFDNCSQLTNIDGAKNWVMTYLKNAAFMFSNTAIENIVDTFSDWSAHNLISTKCMFYACHALTNIQSADNLTSNMVKDGNINGMFTYCTELTSIFGMHALIPANITYTSGVFKNCSKLTDIASAGSWTMTNKVSVYELFYACPITPDGPPALENWDVSSVMVFDRFMPNAATTGAIDDTVNPYPPYYTKISPNLRPLEAWNVDYSTRNTVYVFGYEYSSTHGNPTLPYVYEEDSGGNLRRVAAVSWYKNESNAGTPQIWGSNKELLNDTDIHFDAP